MSGVEFGIVYVAQLCAPLSKGDNMSYLKALLLTTTLLLLSSPTMAKTYCTDAKIKPLSEMVGTWGAGVSDMTTKLREKYKGKGTVKFDKDTDVLTVQFNRSSQTVFDIIFYKFRAGKMYMVGFSYSNRFQAKAGGILAAFKLLANKVIERAKGEKADNVDTSTTGTVVATWNSSSVYTELRGSDPNSLFLKFQCSTLLEELDKQVSNSLNTGF